MREHIRNYCLEVPVDAQWEMGAAGSQQAKGNTLSAKGMIVTAMVPLLLSAVLQC